MALIDEKKFLLNLNGNLCDKQVNFFSQTSLLNSRIEFKSEKELSSDDDSDSDETMSIQKLKTKYHVLQPDNNNSDSSGSNTTTTSKLYSNGFFSNLKVKQPSLKPADKDGNELGQPRHILYPPENIILEWKRLSKIGSGLQNLGNTCFMNSVLQCLTYCPPLVNYLFSIKDDHSAKCRLNFCMICLMCKHVTLALRNCQTLKPLYICQRLKSIAKHFTFGQQEDAHEFLRYVIDHMWRACLSIHEHEFGISGMASKFDQLTKATTAINQIFGGYHRSQVICLQCKEKSNTYDYFMDFMLDIQNISSLEQALDKFVAPEILRNDNAYKCSRCKKSVVAKKQFSVHRAPNVATFQFKRFDCNRMFGKITKVVSYPEKLNLRPYMSEKGPPLMYKLISVLVHFGSSSSSGHYYCYVRNSNNCWYLMNDSQVNQVNLGEVLNQKAYVLFYIRIPSPDNNSNKFLPQMNAQPKHALYLNANIPKQSQPNLVNKSSLAASFSNAHTSINSVFASNKSPVAPEPLVKVNSSTSISLKINFGKNNGQHVVCSNGISKTSTLVPYGEEEDSDDSGKKTKKSNGESKPESNSVSTSTQDCKSNGKVNSMILTKTNNNEESKATIPILKVKATTNSWQVVETTSSRKSNDDNDVKTTSNWKISKTNDLVKENKKSSISPEKNGSSSSSSSQQEKSSKSSDSSDFDSRTEESHRIKKKKEKKKEKKKHKKNKEKKKKLKSSQQSDDSDFESTELSWVERTKETLDMENSNESTNIPAPAIGEKRKLDQVDDKVKDSSEKQAKFSDYGKKFDILDALLKKSSNGYGENVKTWNGENSNLNLKSEDSKSNSYNSDDEYNEEFDRGKVKKIKDKADSFKKDWFSKANPFQYVQQMKYKVGNSTNGHGGFRGGPFHKQQHPKQSNGGKSHFKFDDSKRHFYKHDKFAKNGGGGGGAFHSKFGANSNNSFRKPSFKFR